MLDYEEKAIMRKVAATCELAGNNGYEPICFMKNWLASPTAHALYNMYFKEISQSKQYLFHSVIAEMGLTPSGIYEPDLLYWAGYILTAFSFYYKLEPKTVLERYEIDRILKCYDTLHTVSTTNAVNRIKEDFVRVP